MWIFVLFIALIVVIAILSAQARAKRRKELSEWGAAHGLTFTPDSNYGWDARFPAFRCLRQGDNRYAYNILFGRWGERSFIGFDYHYETHSTDSKGHRQTHHHHFSAVILEAGIPLQPLEIRPEGFFDRIGAFFGFEDINFESAEFSRKFHVTAPDRRWAYDVLHVRSIEYLMAAPVFSIAFDDARVIAHRSATFRPDEFGQAADVIAGLLDRLPDYLVRQQVGPAPAQPPPLPPPPPQADGEPG